MINEAGTLGEPGGGQTIPELLEAAMRKHKTNQRGLSRVAEAGGHKLASPKVSELLRGRYHSQPGRELLEAIAYVAGVSYETVHRAAFPGSRPTVSFAAELPARIDELGGELRRAALAVLRGIVNLQVELDEVTRERDQLRAERERLLGSTGERVTNLHLRVEDIPDDPASTVNRSGEVHRKP